MTTITSHVETDIRAADSGDRNGAPQPPLASLPPSCSLTRALVSLLPPPPTWSPEPPPTPTKSETPIIPTLLDSTNTCFPGSSKGSSFNQDVTPLSSGKKSTKPALPLSSQLPPKRPPRTVPITSVMPPRLPERDPRRHQHQHQPSLSSSVSTMSSSSSMLDSPQDDPQQPPAAHAEPAVTGGDDQLTSFVKEIDTWIDDIKRKVQALEERHRTRMDMSVSVTLSS